MGFFDNMFNGVVDTVAGPAEFVVDVVSAGRSAVTGDFGGAAETVFNSVQEDLLGRTVAGLFGPEGIGGTLIGALPEGFRDPARSVIDPVFGAWDWTIQEIVDRPLGTLFTVVNATHQNGVSSLFDARTYAKAWDINDKRTFGQAFAANLYFIDPFDEDEYNSIQDDPLFNLISGTADFVQEFIDPVTIIGGTAIKAARGGAVMGNSARSRGAGRLLATDEMLDVARTSPTRIVLPENQMILDDFANNGGAWDWESMSREQKVEWAAENAPGTEIGQVYARESLQDVVQIYANQLRDQLGKDSLSETELARAGKTLAYLENTPLAQLEEDLIRVMRGVLDDPDTHIAVNFETLDEWAADPGGVYRTVHERGGTDLTFEGGVAERVSFEGALGIPENLPAELRPAYGYVISGERMREITQAAESKVLRYLDVSDGRAVADDSIAGFSRVPEGTVMGFRPDDYWTPEAATRLDKIWNNEVLPQLADEFLSDISKIDPAKRDYIKFGPNGVPTGRRNIDEYAPGKGQRLSDVYDEQVRPQLEAEFGPYGDLVDDADKIAYGQRANELMDPFIQLEDVRFSDDFADLVEQLNDLDKADLVRRADELMSPHISAKDLRYADNLADEIIEGIRVSNPHYGQHTVVLKPNVLERSKITYGDSVNSRNNFVPVQNATDQQILQMFFETADAGPVNLLDMRQARLQKMLEALADNNFNARTIGTLDAQYLEAAIIGRFKVDDVAFANPQAAERLNIRNVAPTDAGRVEDLRGAVGGRGSLIGRPREITRVYGGGTGIRPVTFLGKRTGIFKHLVKTDKQIDARNAIITNHTQQRVQAFTTSDQYMQIEDVVSKLDSVSDRAEALQRLTGRAGRTMSREAIDLYANATSPVARARTMRALLGDFSVMDEINADAQKLLDMMNRDDWDKIAQALTEAKRMGVRGRQVPPQEVVAPGSDRFNLAKEPVRYSGDMDAAIEFQRIASETDWAVMHQFRQALYDSQQMRTQFYKGRFVNLSDLDDNVMRLGEFAAENDALARAALESILESVDDVNMSKNAIAGLPNVKEMPWGTRMFAVLNNHRRILERKGDDFVLSEFHNPHILGGRPGRFYATGMRLISERTPQTHIFFDDPDSITQFERVVTQAQRVEVGGKKVLGDKEARNLVSSFSRLKLQGRSEELKDLYLQTVEEINQRIDKALYDANMGERLGKEAGQIDPQGRTLTAEYRRQNKRWGEEAKRAVGVTDEAGSTISTRLDDDGSFMVLQHRVSQAQVKNSAVQPRYDVVQRKIELAEARLRSPIRRVPVKIGDVARGAIGKGSELLDGPQQAWRSSMLLTPKWPMRVGMDEQLRAAAVLGGMTQLGTLITSFPELRRAFALHKLDNIDAATDADAITRMLAEEVGVVATADNVYDIYKQAIEQNPDAVKNAVAELRKQKVLAARELKNKGSNVRRLSRNAAAKGIGVGLLLGNPVAGGIYGFAAFMGKRRRVNQALQRKASLNYAETLRHEGERMLREAVGREELAEARRMMDDATHIKKLIDSEDAAVGEAALEAQNAFDSAEKLMADAGVHGLNIGGVSFRNAFGDDTRYQEQIRAEVSSSRSQSALYSGAVRDSERQLRKYQDVDFQVFDALKYDADGNVINAVDIKTQWANMMNRYTSGSDEFRNIVWSNDSIAKRTEDLKELLRGDEALLRELTSRKLDDFADDELALVAKNIVEEYNDVLPPYFKRLREDAAMGKAPSWGSVLNEMKRDPTLGKNAIERITRMRESHPGFGKAVAPEPVSHQGAMRRGLMEGVSGWAEDLFKMFGTLPTDELARNPFFRTRYERELRRRVALLQDPDGQVRISQRNIDEIERQAREASLKEVREVMYDLAENTRISEMVGNSMPFFNAWQEVIGRWAGFAVENPTFVGNALRLYRKPWDAQALGISEVTVENPDGSEGATYLMFRPFGPAYDSDGNETTIFDAMSPTMRNLLIPEMLRDQDATVRFSKEGLNTIMQSPAPGFGPLITIPVREAILARPGLEETFGFMFPFGHPEGGFFERAIKGNAPTWAKSVDDYFRDSQTRERLVQRMFQDIVTQRAESGDPLDWSNDMEVNAAIELANDRARDFSLFRVAAGFFSPTSTTLLSPYEPMVQEARRLQREHGTLEGNAMFLDRYGEDFFALTARMTKLNDGVAASIESEELYLKHQDLVQAHPEIGAWVTASLGGADEEFVFSQAVYRRQMNMELAPGSEQMRRERKTPLEAIADTQAELGWKKYTELQDYKRSKQEEAIALGMSGSMNASHMRPLSAYLQQEIDALRAEHPAWAEQFDDYGRSTRRMAAIVDGFVAGLQDEQLLLRPSTEHVIDYFELRMYVQRRLQEREQQGGSDNLGADSNEDLLLYWEQSKEQLSYLPAFSAIYDRYFARDKLDRATFVSDDAFEGLF